MMAFEGNFYIGYISKTRGLKGEIQLFFEFGDYKELEPDVLFLEISGKLVPFFIEIYKLQPNHTAYLFLEDIDHIDKAKPLVHKRVYLPNSKKPERHPDDFRITDFKGYVVEDEEYGELGEITSVHEYPQQYVAVVLYKSNELMFPLNDQLIRMIDKENKRLQVRLPDGLVDVYM